MDQEQPKHSWKQKQLEDYATGTDNRTKLNAECGNYQENSLLVGHKSPERIP